MADEKGVRIDSGPETLAMQWMFKDGKLSSVATGQVLGLGSTLFAARPRA